MYAAKLWTFRCSSLFLVVALTIFCLFRLLLNQFRRFFVGNYDVNSTPCDVVSDTEGTSFYGNYRRVHSTPFMFHCHSLDRSPIECWKYLAFEWFLLRSVITPLSQPLLRGFQFSVIKPKPNLSLWPITAQANISPIRTGSKKMALK